MGHAGRRSGHRRRRWIVLGVVITITVLAVDALVTSRDHGPAEQQAALAYLDNVRPLVDRSTQQGADLANVRANALTLGREVITRQLDRATRESADVLAAGRQLDPPPSMRDAADLLTATFAIRARAAETVRQALQTALGTDPPAAAVTGLANAGNQMVASDTSYQLVAGSLPPGTPLPASQWVTDQQSWNQQVLTDFVTTLRSSQVSAPVHDLAISLVLIDPAAVGTDGETTILPTARNLRLQIVVTDLGNQGERNVTVSATITPAAIGPTDTARDFVDLTPGQRRTVVLGTLRPAPNTPFTLAVQIGPVEGETNVADNSKTGTYLMR